MLRAFDTCVFMSQGHSPDCHLIYLDADQSPAPPGLSVFLVFVATTMVLWLVLRGIVGDPALDRKSGHAVHAIYRALLMVGFGIQGCVFLYYCLPAIDAGRFLWQAENPGWFVHVALGLGPAVLAFISALGYALMCSARTRRGIRAREGSAVS